MKATAIFWSLSLAWQFGQSSGGRLLSVLQLYAVAGGWVTDGWTAACELLFSWGVKAEAMGLLGGGGQVGWVGALQVTDAASATFCDPKQVPKSAQIRAGGKIGTTYLREGLQGICSHI